MEKEIHLRHDDEGYFVLLEDDFMFLATTNFGLRVNYIPDPCILLHLASWLQNEMMYNLPLLIKDRPE